jgi:hypothetical protein
MQNLEFNTRTKELKSISDGERHSFQRGFLQGAASLEHQPVDRTKFFTNDTELEAAINGLSTVFVGKDDDADTRGVLDASASLIRLGDELQSSEVQAIVEADEAIGVRLDDLVTNARTQRHHQAHSEDWWDRFSDEKHFSHSVFLSDPTEQIVIGRDQIEPVTVYNFGEKLHRSHIESVIGAVAAMSVLTDGYTRALTPYIVIHEAFLNQHFQQSNTVDKPAARAWLGEPFIEARRSTFDTPIEGSRGQSWVSKLIAHEISHQIDEEVSPSYPDFSNYFHYIDENGDGLIDYVKPLSSFASVYNQDELSTSLPVNPYGFTNSAEDLATVGEEVAFDGYVDPLRRDAYMKVIEAFKQKGAMKYGEMQPMPESLKVEVARGGEIQLPVAAALSRPIQIRLENTGLSSIGDIWKNLFSK